MPVRNIFKILILLIFITINLKCSVYSFKGHNPPEGIETVAVPLFENTSGFSEANIREEFTENLKNRIIDDNTFTIADKNVADGIVKCNITNVRDEALVISGNENVTKRKVTITVTVLFENLNKQKQVWDRTFENWGEYSSSATTFSNRETGIKDATEKICEDILNGMTSNW